MRRFTTQLSLCFLFTIGIVLSLPAQNFDWIYTSDGGGGIVEGSATDAAGNFYLGITFRDTIELADTSLTPESIAESVLARIGTDGKVDWLNRFIARPFTGTVFPLPAANIRHVDLSENGKVHVLLYFLGQIVLGEDTVIAQGHHNHLLMRFSKSGILENYVQLIPEGNFRMPEYRPFIIDPDGDVTLNMRLEGKVFTSTGDTIIKKGSDREDFVLVRFEPNGRISDRFQTRSGHGITHYDMDTDESGNLYVTLRSAARIPFGNLYLGNRSLHLIKLDPNLMPVRDTPLRTSIPHEAQYALSVAADGTSYIAGEFRDSLKVLGSTIKNTGHYQDLFLLKLDTDGKLRWLNRIAGSGVDYISALDYIPTTGKLTLMGGHYEDLQLGPFYLPDSTYNFSGVSVFMTQADTSGNFEWVLRGLNLSSFKPGYLSHDLQGNIHFSARYGHFLQLGTTMIDDLNGYFDGVYGRIVPLVTASASILPHLHNHHAGIQNTNPLKPLSLLPKSESNLSLYPTVSSGRFTLYHPEMADREALISVMNTAGQVVNQQTISRQNAQMGISLDLSNSKGGLYILRFESKTNTEFRKLLITKD